MRIYTVNNEYIYAVFAGKIYQNFICKVFKIITIPFHNNSQTFQDEILTNFTINKRIKNCHAKFFISEGKPYWTVFLEYDAIMGKNTDSETHGLNEAQKMLFDKLRLWRKEKADTEGVPVYIVATNREVNDLVRVSPKSLEEMATIKGFGRKKVEKYGNDVIAIIRAFYTKT